MSSGLRHDANPGRDLWEQRSFEQCARASLDAIKTASERLIESAVAVNGGQPIRSASQLKRTLGVPLTLAWRIYRIATARDVLTEASTVPGSRAVRGLVKAAEDRGIRPEPLDALSESVRRFEEVVRDNAGDRETFNAIVSEMGSEIQSDPHLQARKDAYRANSQIHGVQLCTRLLACIVHPSSDSHADVVSIAGVVGLSRLHGDARFPFWASAAMNGEHDVAGLASPLCPTDSQHPGSTLLADFCSRPLPTMHSRVSRDGHLITELSPLDLGHRHAATAFTSERYSAVTSRTRTENEPHFSTELRVFSPTRVGIIDVIIADSTYGRDLPVPTAALAFHSRGLYLNYSDLGGPDARILCRPSVLYLGTGASAVAGPDVPRYPEMFEYVCSRVGWNTSSFHVFRCRVEYPALASSIVAGFDLPNGPIA